MDDNKGLWVGGIIIAVIIVLFGLWWFVSTGTGSTGMATSTPPATQTTGGTKVPPIAGKVPSEARKTADVVAIAASIAGTSEFNSLFSSTGVKATVTGQGPYTIFVPTNTAFAALPAGTISGLTVAEKKRLVQYHVVSGRAIDPDAVNSGVVAALSKDAINFAVLDDGSVRVNSSAITRAYIGSNGVVYVINAVLLPPKSTVIE